MNLHLDLDRWRQLREAADNAHDDGPAMVTVQSADGRARQAREAVARFKAAGVQGRASGPAQARGHHGERILPGVGGTQPADLERAFTTALRELEQRAEEAEREAQRLRTRLRDCAHRRNELNRLLADVRRWAEAQTPPVMLPGDTPARPVVTLAGPPPGTPDFLGRTA